MALVDRSIKSILGFLRISASLTGIWLLTQSRKKIIDGLWWMKMVFVKLESPIMTLSWLKTFWFSKNLWPNYILYSVDIIDITVRIYFQVMFTKGVQIEQFGSPFIQACRTPLRRQIGKPISGITKIGYCVEWIISQFCKKN